MGRTATEFHYMFGTAHETFVHLHNVYLKVSLKCLKATPLVPQKVLHHDMQRTLSAGLLF